jgi:hypothetical protein
MTCICFYLSFTSRMQSIDAEAGAMLPYRKKTSKMQSRTCHFTKPLNRMGSCTSRKRAFSLELSEALILVVFGSRTNMSISLASNR